ncbi:probable E3 ubiquitin ligase complex SCF subunit sconB isoform X2 [Nematostella vectensis]|uniref:probable E3 ubiquitin ligase complex SCF subunit sconB isoform X2 n=1 Tax=Nematostella vectensis TaxID=45351 RepID=UPI0013902CEF|nr:probable E3 ubiquitin ligase complex SCF subunit sconB isoform X2 [Nematostella vectensis]
MADGDGREKSIKFLPTIKHNRTIQASKDHDMKFKTFSKPLMLPSIELMYADLDQVSTLFSKKQLNKKVCEWFSSWRPWQKRILLCSLTEKCTKPQLQALFTTLQPVFHRDFIAKLRGSYPTALIQPKLVHTISTVMNEAELMSLNLDTDSSASKDGTKLESFTEDIQQSNSYISDNLKELLKPDHIATSSNSDDNLQTSFNEVTMEEGVEYGKVLTTERVTIGIPSTAVTGLDQCRLHEHAPKFSRKVSTPNFFSPCHDSGRLGFMKSINRTSDIARGNGWDPLTFKHSKWWDGHRGARLLKPRRSKLSNFFKAQLNQIKKWLEEWPSYERVDMLSEIVKCCDPECLNFFALCLSQRLREETGLNCVPDQTLLKIFSLLDVRSLCNSSQVCRRWRYLGQEGTLWRGRIDNLGKSEGIVNLTEKIEALSNDQYVDWKQAYREVYQHYHDLANAKVAIPIQEPKETKKEKKVRIDVHKEKNKEPEDNTCNLRTSSRAVDVVVTKSLEDVGPAQSPTTTDQRSQIDEFESRPEDQNDLTGGNLKMLARGLRALMRENDADKEEELALDVRPALVQAANVLKESDHPDRSRFRYLSLAVQGVLTIKRVRRLQGHMDVVLCLQFDRRRVVTGSSDRTIRMWDVRSGRSIRKMKGHKGGVRCLQFDNERIISGSWDMTIMVWHIVKFTRLHVLYGHKGCVSCLRFDENTLVSGSHDSTIRVWDMRTWECVLVLQGHEGAVSCLEFDAPFVLSGSADKTIKLWNVESGDCLNTLRGHADAVTSVKVIGELILSGSADGMILFWDLDSGHCEAAIQAHEGPVHSLSYANDHFFSAGGDNMIKEWDVGTCTCLRTLQGHRGPVQDVMVAGRRIVTCSSDGSVRIWDLAGNTPEQGQSKSVSVGENTIETKTIKKHPDSEFF